MSNQGADVWHLVGRYFSVVDLCRCMQVSPTWFHLWVSDRAWNHQRKRMCAMFPELTPVFDKWCDQGASGEHTSKRSQKSNSNKKRKTAWITPRRGIWYVFKKWLMMGTNIPGIKKVCKREDTQSIIISFFKTWVPLREKIIDAKLTIVKHKNIEVVFWWSSRVKMTFWLEHGCGVCNVKLEGFHPYVIRDEIGRIYWAFFHPERTWTRIFLQRELADNDIHPWGKYIEEIVKTRL
jgi:hypothetical protein